MKTDAEMQKTTAERATAEILIDKRIYWILRNCSDAVAAVTATTDHHSISTIAIAKYISEYL